MATADVSPYGNPGTAEQGVQPAGVNTPGTISFGNTPNVRADAPRDEGKLIGPFPAGWPRGNRAYPVQHSGQIVEPMEITPEQDAAVTQLYEQLKPEATQEARDYVLSRTPALYQDAMIAKIEADWPLPPIEDPLARDPRGREGAQNQRRDANPNVDPNLPPYGSGPQSGPLA